MLNELPSSGTTMRWCSETYSSLELSWASLLRHHPRCILRPVQYQVVARYVLWQTLPVVLDSVWSTLHSICRFYSAF